MASALTFSSPDGDSIILSADGLPKDELRYRDWTRMDDEFVKSGGLPRDQMMRFLTDMYYEPAWRTQADVDVDYFDGYQLTPAQLEIYQERKLPPLVINLIQPLVNSVLGLEAKTRSDWDVTYEDDASEEVSKALGKKMKDAERETYADLACSEAYAGQVKAGLGWVEVSDSSNPFRYRYRVQSVHRSQIWWDWRDTDVMLRNARWLTRKQWFDNDILKQVIPGCEPLLGSNPIDSTLMALDHVSDTTNLAASREYERAISMEMAEWRDTERGRSILYEVWYRVWYQGFVIRLPNDEVIELDRQNFLHMQAIAKGIVKPLPAWWPKMRSSLWMGPHRIKDDWSPLPHQDFPYIPFWGFREDLANVPYGLIRALRSPQDEVNARRSKLMALLNARRVEADSDALDETFNTHKTIANQASSHNYYIVRNPNAKNSAAGHTMKIDTNLDLAQGQFEILKESKQEMHEVSGIFTAQQGQAPGMSGYAINSLVEQGNTTLAEINDNYRAARRQVGTLLFRHVRRDAIGQEHSVTVGEGQNRRKIVLNGHTEGGGMMNVVALSTAKVVLQDVPSTSSYRQQQFLILAEMTKALPPMVQQFIVDFVIEASDIPERKAAANRVRQVLGLPDPETGQAPGLPPQVQQQMEQQQAAIQELSVKLQAAMNEIKTGNMQHANKMQELDAQRELTLLKAEAQAQAIGQKSQLDTQQHMHKLEAGAQEAENAAEDAGEPGEESTVSPESEKRILQVLTDLSSKVEDLESKVAQPRRSVVKELGNGEYSVLTVPIQPKAAPEAPPAAGIVNPAPQPPPLSPNMPPAAAAPIADAAAAPLAPTGPPSGPPPGVLPPRQPLTGPGL